MLRGEAGFLLQLAEHRLDRRFVAVLRAQLLDNLDDHRQQLVFAEVVRRALHLVVDGTAALELQYLSAQLIARVNACLGSGAVARLKLRPGRINPPPRTLAAQNAQPAAPDPIPADADPLSFALESLRRRLKAKSQAL